MKTLLAALPLALLCVSPLSLSATNACESISCDCGALPSQAWQDVCQLKENNLKKSCNNNPQKTLGYCSIHGPAATHLPLSLDLTTTSIEQNNSMKVLNNKFAAVYWSMHQDLDFIEKHISQQKYLLAQERLDGIQANLAKLFDFEKNMVAILSGSDNSATIEQSWRNFAEDTAVVAQKLQSFGSTLLTNAKSDTSTNKADTENIAVAMLQAAGNTFEHVGYGYAKGMRHKMAAEAWQEAANSNSLILAEATSASPQDQQRYRYQAATRLHRASYNWMMAIDQKSAQNALIESQEYVNDSDVNIENIIDNPELITSY